MRIYRAPKAVLQGGQERNETKGVSVFALLLALVGAIAVLGMHSMGWLIEVNFELYLLVSLSLFICSVLGVSLSFFSLLRNGVANTRTKVVFLVAALLHSYVLATAVYSFYVMELG